MTEQEQVATIKHLVNRWQERLGLHQWDIEVRPDPALWEKGDAMLTTYDNAYLRATIAYAPQGFEHYSIETADADGRHSSGVEHSVVHELCHLAVAPMRYWLNRYDTAIRAFSLDTAGNFGTSFEDAEESVVEHLARRYIAAYGKE